MSQPQGFPDFLRSRLPQKNKVRVYHVSTPPASCPPLFAAAAGQLEEATTLESHFLSISQPQPRTDHHAHAEHASDILVLGVEVLIFSTARLTTVFVSKADSSGFLVRSAAPLPGRTPLVQIVITAFLEFLLHTRQSRVPLVLSLFARSQNQYLFPGSVENATKHVLDDRQLIKWWCRVLDPIIRRPQKDVTRSAKAHVVVPGCDTSETKTFFPPSSRSDPRSDPLWLNAYPVNLLVDDTSLPPRCLVPRLPDDPKSRFLDDLDAQRDENGVWRGIKSLELFWQMMAHRQECSAGRLVGFIWIVFLSTSEYGDTSAAVNDEIFTRQAPDEKPSVSKSSPVASSKLVNPYEDCTSAKDSHDPVRYGLDPTGRSSRSVTPLPTAVENANTKLSPGEPAALGDEPEHVASSTPEAQRSVVVSSRIPVASGSAEKIVLSAEDYQSLMDELLQLDFAGEDLATESSIKWRQRATRLAGTNQFGVDVEGALAAAVAAITDSNETVQTSVNVLTGIRKKRKAADAETTSNGCAPKEHSVTILATNLVRKKPKP